MNQPPQRETPTIPFSPREESASGTAAFEAACERALAGGPLPDLEEFVAAAPQEARAALRRRLEPIAERYRRLWSASRARSAGAAADDGPATTVDHVPFGGPPAETSAHLEAGRKEGSETVGPRLRNAGRAGPRRHGHRLQGPPGRP
jgi:hypothetical protein